MLTAHKPRNFENERRLSLSSKSLRAQESERELAIAVKMSKTDLKAIAEQH